MSISVVHRLALASGLFQDLSANVSSTALDDPALALSPIRVRLRTMCTIRFLAVFLFRLSQLAGKRSGLLASLVKQLNQFITGADVAWQAVVGPGLVLSHPNGVVVGPFCEVGEGCRIQQGVTIGGNGRPGEGSRTSPKVGCRVVIGPGARIFGAITIGDRCLVGANAVVLRDVPSGFVAVGVPAASRPQVSSAPEALHGD